jgi:transcription elongation factor GreA
MAEEVILTEEGFKKIKKELINLKTVKRKEIAEQIKDAKEYGDISENAEYDDAKNEQAFIEGRIADLEKMIKHAKIVRKSNKCDHVILGCNVVIASDGEEKKYTIVGPQETDPSSGKISHESPLGRALIDKVVGEVVSLKLPHGKMQYRIVAIE